MNRRDILTGAVGMSVLAGVRRRTEADEASTSARSHRPKTFLLIHGAWHAAAHWSETARSLVIKGHRVLAIDLPGNGLKAKYPAAYLKQDLAALATEVSPLKGITREDYVDSTVAAIRELATSGEKVTVVGHSMGGLVITRAGEEVPELIQRLVYLTAFCPVKLPSLLAYGELPEGAGNQVGSLVVGKPSEVGAVRLNPRSADPAYRERARETFYNDLTMEQFLPFASGLSPDQPLGPVSSDTRGTRERWGMIPRTYVRCTKDNAIPIALQDRMIQEADEFTPNNRFDVKTLETSHSPFASQPRKLAEILSELG